MHAAIACSPKLITGDFLATDRHVLLIGESGIGKSTLAAALARTLAQTGRGREALHVPYDLAEGL